MPATTDTTAEPTPPDDPLEDPLRRIDHWIALADGRGQLMRALDGVDETAASLPLDLPKDARGARWLVGDVVTHLAAWDTLIAERLRALVDGAAGVEVTASADDQWAAWNAEQIAEGRSRTLAARLKRLVEARQALLEAAGAIDEAVLDTAVATTWGIEETPRAILVVQAMHDGMHAEAITAALTDAPRAEPSDGPPA